MFDIGTDELLFTAVVAIVVIGPKDLPRALRLAGSWIGKIRRVSGHFRAGVEEMIRQAELQEMEQKWREQNEAILSRHPGTAAESGSEIMSPQADAGLVSAEQPAAAARPGAEPSSHEGPLEPPAAAQ